MAEEDPEQVAAVQHKLQQIVVSVARTHSRAPVDDVRHVLVTAIGAAGIPEQPHKWIDDTANEIAEGRLVVLNARESRRAGIPTAYDDDLRS
jgi:hypothetical protein